MAINVTNKASSANSNTPSRVITRQEVSMGKPSPSTARVQALKDKLNGKPPSQPVAPRPARTSSRAEEFAKLNKFTTSPQNVVSPSQPKPKTSARAEVQDFNAIPPPPSGLAPGQEPVTQPANIVEPAPKAVEASNAPLSPQQAAIARDMQRLRKAQQAFKAEQEAWKQDQANYVPKSRLSSETLKVLAEAGVTNDKLLELQTQQAETADPIQDLKNEIAQLKAQLLDPEKGVLAERDKQAYSAAVKQITTDATLLVESNPAYGTIKSEGKIPDVVELVTSVFDQEGIILDVEEAAQLVEDKLVERLLKQYDRISKYEKIKAKYGKPAEQEEASLAQPTPQHPKTLTNAGSAVKQLTPRERAIMRVQEAIDAKNRK